MVMSLAINAGKGIDHGLIERIFDPFYFTIAGAKIKNCH